MFFAYCADTTGRNKTLGRFKNSEQSFNAYCKYKESIAKDWLDKLLYIADSEVLSALSNFKVVDYL